jgi:hypothetical protein
MTHDRQPLSKYSLRYDKLLVDKDVYVFNELSGLVERVGSGIQEEMDFTASSSPTTPYRLLAMVKDLDLAVGDRIRIQTLGYNIRNNKSVFGVQNTIIVDK